MKLITITSIAGLLFAQVSISQGTNCAGATSITSNSSCSTQAFSISNGNSGSGTSSCVSGINDDAWYTFTATSSVSNVDITGASNNIAIVIYSGTCGALTEIGCDDQGTTNASAIAATTSGTTYYVRIIRTNSGGGSTTGNVCVTGVTNLVTNGNFTGGATGWTACGNGTEVMATSQWHGGVVPFTPNSFAEIDGHLDFVAGTADDIQICQNVAGFTIGEAYTLCMDMQRRPGPSDCTTTFGQPGTVTTTITLNNGALSTNVSMSNTTWGWTQVCFDFIATSTTHLLSLTPNDNSSCGMLVTNVTITPNTTLPVELIGFNAEVTGRSEVNLTWSTASEMNNDYFVVQRSVDGISWESIGQVDGVGTTDQISNYQLVDEKPLFGTSYYRLMQKDVDGKQNYSNIATVELLIDILLYPNPSHGAVTVAMEEEVRSGSIEIFDVRGQLVQTFVITEGKQWELQLPEIKGVCLVSIHANGLHWIQRVVNL